MIHKHKQKQQIETGTAAPKACPNCGCVLENHSWRNCPRCQHELAGCSGCGQCRCGK